MIVHPYHMQTFDLKARGAEEQKIALRFFVEALDFQLSNSFGRQNLRIHDKQTRQGKCTRSWHVPATCLDVCWDPLFFFLLGDGGGGSLGGGGN